MSEKILVPVLGESITEATICLLYTSDAADEQRGVDLGGRRIIKKKKTRIENNKRRNKSKQEKNHTAS